jgi:hypothetical protein
MISSSYDRHPSINLSSSDNNLHNKDHSTMNFVSNAITTIAKDPVAALDSSGDSDDTKEIRQILTSIKNSHNDSSEISFNVHGDDYSLSSDENDGVSIVNHSRGEKTIIPGLTISELKQTVKNNNALLHYLTSHDLPHDSESIGTESLTEEFDYENIVNRQEDPIDYAPSTAAYKFGANSRLESNVSSIASNSDDPNIAAIKSMKVEINHANLCRDGIDTKSLIDFRRYAANPKTTTENCDEYAALINPRIDQALAKAAPSDQEKAALQDYTLTSGIGLNQIKTLSSTDLVDELKQFSSSSTPKEKMAAYLIAHELNDRRDQFINNIPAILHYPSLKFTKDITPKNLEGSGITFNSSQNATLKIKDEEIETLGFALLGAKNSVCTEFHPGFMPEISVNIHDRPLAQGAFTNGYEYIMRGTVSAETIKKGPGTISGMLSHEFGVHSFDYVLSDDDRKAENKILGSEKKFEAKIGDTNCVIQPGQGKSQQADHLIVALDALVMCGTQKSDNTQTTPHFPRGQVYRHTTVGMINGVQNLSSLDNKKKKDTAKEILATYCLDLSRIIVSNDLPANNKMRIATKGIPVAMGIYDSMKIMYPTELAGIELSGMEMAKYAVKTAAHLQSMAKNGDKV